MMRKVSKRKDASNYDTLDGLNTKLEIICQNAPEFITHVSDVADALKEGHRKGRETILYHRSKNEREKLNDFIRQEAKKDKPQRKSIRPRSANLKPIDVARHYAAKGIEFNETQEVHFRNLLFDLKKDIEVDADCRSPPTTVNVVWGDRHEKAFKAYKMLRAGSAPPKVVMAIFLRDNWQSIKAMDEAVIFENGAHVIRRYELVDGSWRNKPLSIAKPVTVKSAITPQPCEIDHTLITIPRYIDHNEDTSKRQEGKKEKKAISQWRELSYFEKAPAELQVSEAMVLQQKYRISLYLTVREDYLKELVQRQRQCLQQMEDDARRNACLKKRQELFRSEVAIMRKRLELRETKDKFNGMERSVSEPQFRKLSEDTTPPKPYFSPKSMLRRSSVLNTRSTPPIDLEALTQELTRYVEKVRKDGGGKRLRETKKERDARCIAAVLFVQKSFRGYCARKYCRALKYIRSSDTIQCIFRRFNQREENRDALHEAFDPSRMPLENLPSLLKEFGVADFVYVPAVEMYFRLNMEEAMVDQFACSLLEEWVQKHLYLFFTQNLKKMMRLAANVQVLKKKLTNLIDREFQLEDDKNGRKAVISREAGISNTADCPRKPRRASAMT